LIGLKLDNGATGLSTSGDLAPIVAFQLNLVGPTNAEQSYLWSGAGTITYNASTILTASNSLPGDTDSDWRTLEDANSVYGVLPAAPANTLVQSFNTVVPPAYTPGLLVFRADPRLLGASIGFLAVLHTWGQNLHLHPHLHCVVPGGGISPDGSRWIACCKSSFFLPVRVRSRRFRKKFLGNLRKAFHTGGLHFFGELRSLADPASFHALCENAAGLDWVVHVKPAFGGPQRVLKYLARYTHRAAISNHRIRSLENGRVTFDWKDYRDHARTKTMTLDAVEFMRRFLLHVLPSGFVRIRQFGFLANRVRQPKLAQCRMLLAVGSVPPPADSHSTATNLPDVHACPICKRGCLIVIELLGAEPATLQDTS
jgi:Putative transposase